MCGGDGVNTDKQVVVQYDSQQEVVLLQCTRVSEELFHAVSHTDTAAPPAPAHRSCSYHRRTYDMAVDGPNTGNWRLFHGFLLAYDEDY